MDARQIQDLRAMLAAQAVAKEEPPQGLLHRLSRLLAPPAAEATLPLDLTADMTLSPPAAVEDQPLWLTETMGAPTEPMPAEILLGAFCPRRPAFGQRAEPAPDPAPAPRALMAQDVAENDILMHDSGAAIRVPPRRPREALHTETPFFPEDLADDPRSGGPALLLGPALPPFTPARAQARQAQAAPAALAAPSPPSELAGAFLLANLAARLASEDQGLRQSLASLPASAVATPKPTGKRRRASPPRKAPVAIEAAPSRIQPATTPSMAAIS